MNHFYHTVETSDNAQFRINAIFKEDSLELTVLQKGAAYNSEVSKDCLMTLSKNQGMNFAEYFSGLKNYFEETHPEKIQFLFKDKKFSVNFLLENKMKKIYFQSSLNLVNYDETVLSMLDTLYNDKFTYFQGLTEEQNKNAKVTADYDTLDRKLTELSERRKTEEVSLYNKFIRILNEKKRQIQHLNELLHAFVQGRPTINPPSQTKQKKPRQKTKEPVNNVKTEQPNSPDASDYDIESNESDDNYTTDEEKNAEKHNKSPVPGTSKESVADVDIHEMDTQPFTFPRRINSETSFKIERLSPKKETEDEQKNGEITAKRPKIEKKTSVVDYDTQDLLDNLD